MTNRGPLIAFAAVACLAGGLFALYLPVFIGAYDQFGWQVKCGNGFMADLAQASSAGSAAGSDYVGQCNGGLMVRRLWAIPLAVLGGIALTWEAGAVLARDHHRPTPPASATQSRRGLAARPNEIRCE